MPSWLVTMSCVGTLLGVASAVIVAVDLVRGHGQRMWIMNIVWPVTALWAAPLGAWFYF